MSLPNFLGVIKFSDNLVHQLILDRQRVLRQKHPQFKLQFQSLQNSLKNHKQQLQKNWSLSTDKEIIQKVLIQVQVNNYRFSMTERTKRISNSKPKKSQIYGNKQFDQKKLPYYHKKFKKSLKKYDLSCTLKKEKLQWKNLNKKDSIDTIYKSKTIRFRKPISLNKQQK